MHPVDLTILLVYLVATIGVGAWFSRSHRSIQDYFVSGHRVPWWAIMGSIVATETSTVTFISVPGFAYTTNFTFLQLVMGYMLGRVVIALVFIPAYFKGELLTVYQLLGDRFGVAVKRFASGLFLTTRTLADGFRLFATGLVLAALLLSSPGAVRAAEAWAPGSDPSTAILVAAVCVIGLATILYTYLGGMAAVIWTDVVQLFIYLIGAVAAALVLVSSIPGGWTEAVAIAGEHGKLQIFDFTWDITRSYTFWSGVVGGMFLTTATHGTDQLMVQRYLCSRTRADATRALLGSGVMVFAQFVLFLFIGAMLFAYYEGPGIAERAAFSVSGRVVSDRIFPTFIVTRLPVGLVGLVVAAIFAAAMSTLSSSLNSSAAAAVGDFYIPLARGSRTDAHYLRVSRLMTAFWGVAQMAVALMAIRLSSRVVDEVLGIASFTNGIILGVFLLGTFAHRVRQRSAFAGIAVGTGTMAAVKLLTAVSWQWYVLIGSLVTFAAGIVAAWAGAERAPDPAA